MKWETLTGKQTLFDMFLFTGLLWINNPVLAPQLFILLIGITIGTIIVDSVIYLNNRRKREDFNEIN